LRDNKGGQRLRNNKEAEVEKGERLYYKALIQSNAGRQRRKDRQREMLARSTTTGAEERQ
jgi:hypothetical protein